MVVFYHQHLVGRGTLEFVVNMLGARGAVNYEVIPQRGDDADIVGVGIVVAGVGVVAVDDYLAVGRHHHGGDALLPEGEGEWQGDGL